MAQIDMKAENSATATIRAANGRNSWKGEWPDEAATTSSLSPLSLLRENSVAMNSEIGEMTIRSEGMIRPVT